MLRQIKSPVTSHPSPVFLCLSSAVLLILSFPQFNIWILAWVAFIPLFFALQNQSKLRAFLLAYLTGVVFWAGAIYWLVHVTLLGTVVLVLYLALYFGLFGLFATHRAPSTMHPKLFVIPAAIWVLLEYARSHLLMGGFPWALLGYSQSSNLPIIQIADLTGAYGVSFLVMLLNITIYKVIGDRFLVLGKKRVLFISALLIGTTLAYGYYRLHLTPNTCHLTPTTYNLPPTKISVIQGNIPQDQKWEPESREYILNKYLTLSLAAAKDHPDLVIWPEASLPVILEEEPVFFEQVKHFSKESGLALLIGAVTRSDDSYHNSAILVSKSEDVLARYDKLHLVPFGEYIPLKKYIPFLETIVPIGDISAGKEFTLFQLPVANTAPSTMHPARTTYKQFAVLICFEDVFPELSRQFVKRGASFLVNITNDAWYKETSAAHQHFQASVFRAVENRVLLVRAANTGISGFIAPTGKVISLVQDKTGKEIFVDGYKTQHISRGERPFARTFYTKYGDVFILLLFVLISLYSLFSLKPKKHV